MATATTKPVTLKTGRIVPKGTLIIQWCVNGDHGRCLTECGAVIRCTSAFKAPSIATMESWDARGIARSVAGCNVEPDGYDEHGSPSWMLVLGII
jgi:hypothetical protein